MLICTCQSLSVLRQAAQPIKPGQSLDLITNPVELHLVKKLVTWPKLVESAALAHEPHRIAFYLVDLAGAFHSLWNAGRDNPALRFHIAGQDDLTNARLQLVQATSFIIRAGLNVLSIEAVEEMRDYYGRSRPRGRNNQLDMVWHTAGVVKWPARQPICCRYFCRPMIATSQSSGRS